MAGCASVGPPHPQHVTVTAGGEVEQGWVGRRLKELRILRFSQISRVALRSHAAAATLVLLPNRRVPSHG